MSNATSVLVRFDARFSGQSAHPGPGKIRGALLLWALIAAVAGFVGFGCGAPTANLVLSAPSSAIPGSPFTVTVTAMVNGNRDVAFNSAIHFTSSDSAAGLPVDYQFTAADAGSHTFTNGVILRTAGNQSVTATDTATSFLTGTANVIVSPTSVQ